MHFRSRRLQSPIFLHDLTNCSNYQNGVSVISGNAWRNARRTEAVAIFCGDGESLDVTEACRSCRLRGVECKIKMDVPLKSRTANLTRCLSGCHIPTKARIRIAFIRIVAVVLSYGDDAPSQYRFHAVSVGFLSPSRSLTLLRRAFFFFSPLIRPHSFGNSIRC